MSGGKVGTIILSLNDMAMGGAGYWYADLEEFQTTECPPSKYNYWALPGLTYSLMFVGENRQESMHRVYTIPSQIKSGFRFKVYHDPTAAASKPADPLQAVQMYLNLTRTSQPAAAPVHVTQQAANRMSPSLQRLATLLGKQNDKTTTQKFMRDVFTLLKGQKNVQFGHITKAVQEHVESGLGQPTPQQIAKKLSKLPVAAPTPVAPALAVPAPAKALKKKRKHVSVWEIRK